MTSEPETSNRGPKLSTILIPILIVIGVAWGALSFLRAQLPSKDHAGSAIDFKVGAVLPDLRFEGLDGKVRLLSDGKSKVTLINFWATWCEACMEEMPSLSKLYQKYSSQGFEMIGVNLDEKPAQAIPATHAEFNLGFTSYLDKDGKLGDAFDVHAIPLTIIVDSSRKVLETVSGDRDWMKPSFTQRLETWLSQGDQAKR